MRRIDTYYFCVAIIDLKKIYEWKPMIKLYMCIFAENQKLAAKFIFLNVIHTFLSNHFRCNFEMTDLRIHL
jgi:hypothetical protein